MPHGRYRATSACAPILSSGDRSRALDRDDQDVFERGFRLPGRTVHGKTCGLADGLIAACLKQYFGNPATAGARYEAIRKERTSAVVRISHENRNRRSILRWPIMRRR
jgi:hypothetical protein